MLERVGVASCIEVMNEEDGAGAVGEELMGVFVQGGAVFETPVAANGPEAVEIAAGAVDQPQFDPAVRLADQDVSPVQVLVEKIMGMQFPQPTAQPLGDSGGLQVSGSLLADVLVERNRALHRLRDDELLGDATDRVPVFSPSQHAGGRKPQGAEKEQVLAFVITASESKDALKRVLAITVEF